MAVTKRKRAHKVSRGEHGAKRHPLTTLERVLAGKGLYASFAHVPCKGNWMGAREGGDPYDQRQVEENRKLYPHLFPQQRKAAA